MKERRGSRDMGQGPWKGRGKEDAQADRKVETREMKVPKRRGETAVVKGRQREQGKDEKRKTKMEDEGSGVRRGWGKVGRMEREINSGLHGHPLVSTPTLTPSRPKKGETCRPWGSHIPL